MRGNPSLRPYPSSEFFSVTPFGSPFRVSRSCSVSLLFTNSVITRWLGRAVYCAGTLVVRGFSLLQETAAKKSDSLVVLHTFYSRYDGCIAQRKNSDDVCYFCAIDRGIGSESCATSSQAARRNWHPNNVSRPSPSARNPRRSSKKDMPANVDGPPLQKASPVSSYSAVWS